MKWKNTSFIMALRKYQIGMNLRKDKGELYTENIKYN